MRTYKQTVTFEREVTITARDAAQANEKLEDLINSTEFHGDVRCTYSETFEDEPVNCPTCKGDGVVEDGDDSKTCPQCNGDCSIPFKAE